MGQCAGKEKYIPKDSIEYQGDEVNPQRNTKLNRRARRKLKMKKSNANLKNSGTQKGLKKSTKDDARREENKLNNEKYINGCIEKPMESLANNSTKLSVYSSSTSFHSISENQSRLSTTLEDINVNAKSGSDTYSLLYNPVSAPKAGLAAPSVVEIPGNENQDKISESSQDKDNGVVSDSTPLRDQNLGKSPVRGRMFNSPKPLSGPRVLFKSPLPKHLAFRREKNNSTSSLFIKDTINSPNIDEIIRCMAVALLYHIKNGFNHPEAPIDLVFSEKYHALTRELIDLNNIPDVNTIYRFINLIFRVQKLPPECAILSLAYIEKVLSGGRVVLHPENWRRILFGSVIIATKVWEDESVWNVDFLDLFPLLTLVDLNNLENRFLELLEFNVITSGSEYAKYYFELRALSNLETFPLQPLSKEDQQMLEERSKATNAKVTKFSSTRDVVPKRCRSVDYFEAKSPPAILH